MRFCKIIISAVLLVISASGLHAQERMRIAVMDFNANNVSLYAAKAVSEVINTEIAKKNDVQVIERSQIGTILREQGFQMTGCTDSSCAVEAGRLLSAKKMLIGTVSKLGSMYSIASRVVDVQTGGVDFAESERCTREEDLESASRILAIRLLNRISGRNYSVPNRTYQVDEQRNRFAIAVGGRYGRISGINVPIIDLSGEISSTKKDAVMNGLVISPSYELSENWGIRVDFELDYIDMKDSSTMGTQTEDGAYVVRAYNMFEGRMAQAYSLSLNVQNNYPFGGFIPFVSLGGGIRKYINTTRGINQYAYSAIASGNYHSEQANLSTDPAYAIFGSLQVGVSIYVSRFVELQLLSGIDYPFFSSIYNNVELVQIRSSNTGSPSTKYNDFMANSNMNNNFKGNNPPVYFIGAMVNFRVF